MAKTEFCWDVPLLLDAQLTQPWRTQEEDPGRVDLVCYRAGLVL